MAKRIFAILIMLIAMSAFAEEGRSWWQFWPANEQNRVIEETTANIENYLFTKNERSLLNDYLRQNRANEYSEQVGNKHGGKDKKAKKQKALPPGLIKKVERGGQLPPGWQKKVARGEVFNEDLYLASKGLPQSILNQLPTRPDGTTIRQIDNTIVQVLDATSVILDVLNSNVE